VLPFSALKMLRTTDNECEIKNTIERVHAKYKLCTVHFLWDLSILKDEDSSPVAINMLYLLVNDYGRQTNGFTSSLDYVKCVFIEKCFRLD
jgi:hypothetical protein